MNQSVTSLAILCAGLLGIGYVLLAIFSLVPAVSRKARAIWPEIFIATLVYSVVIGSLYAGGAILMLFFILLAFRSSYEAVTVGCARNPGYSPEKINRLAIAISMGVAIAAYAASLLPFALVIFMAPVVFLFVLLLLFVRKDRSQSGANIALEIMAFPIIPLLVLVTAGIKPHYSALLLAAFILVETFDSYASLGGKIFGRTRAFPVLSPRKTIEGLAIGAAMLTLTAWLVGSYVMNVPFVLSVSIALTAGFLAVFGDLAASRLKRRSAVKDYPVVLPYQGGVLDITDAWISAGSGIVLLAWVFGYH